MQQKATKRARLTLAGTDDIYAKREAKTQEIKPSEPNGRDTVQRTSKVASEEVKTAEKLTQTSSKKANVKDGLEVNCLLTITKKMTEDLAQIAKDHDIEFDDLLKAARTKAGQKFHLAIKDGKKLPKGKILTGGESVRFSTVYPPEAAAKLQNWYDPLDVGLTRKAVKNVMNVLFAAEVAQIISAAKS